MLVGKISGAYASPVFQRRLRDNEKVEYKHDTIRQAYDFLGIKEVAMIMHGSCFPVVKNDLGVGSPFNSDSKKLIEMEKLHGFTGMQLGPLGEITRQSISPYDSTVWAKNRLFIDMNALTGDDYGNILDENALSAYSVPYKEKSNGYEYSKFYEAFENYDILLEKAYDNFRLKVRMKEPNAVKLNQEYSAFKKSDGQRVLKEAMFGVLKNIYGTEDFEKWESDIDKNLPELLDDRNSQAIDRYKFLMNRNGKDIGLYCFTQFLIEKQMKEHKAFRKNSDFKYISDMLVGTSKMEEYTHKDAFLKNIRMGCPSGGKYGPQLWGFPVPDPKKLFNSDGSLGPAGQFIKDKLDCALEDCENVRIDHVFGIINPYVYDENSVEIKNGTLDWGKFRGGFLSQMHDLDPNSDYWKILERIVIPSLKEHGIEPTDAVWEDLGHYPEGFSGFFYDKLKLSGIVDTSYSRVEDTRNQGKGNFWSYIGSHDSAAALNMIKGWQGYSPAWQPDYLAGWMYADPQRADERFALQERIANNPMEKLKAKFAELFLSSDKIQISFVDFFGIDKNYNIGGQKDQSFWKLRLNGNYEDYYYKNLASDNPTAMNLPEILKIAVRAKMDRMIVDKSKSNPEQTDDFRKQINARMQPLLDRLDKFANILKEKE